MGKIIILTTINIVAVIIFGIRHRKNNQTIHFIIFRAIVQTAAFWLGFFLGRRFL
jgi:hypothetical protein